LLLLLLNIIIIIIIIIITNISGWSWDVAIWSHKRSRTIQ